MHPRQNPGYSYDLEIQVRTAYLTLPVRKQSYKYVAYKVLRTLNSTNVLKVMSK